MRLKRYFVVLSLVSLLSLLIFSSIFAQQKAETWPERVLITNDNGIRDIKIIELARAFSRVAETYVVAPLEDKSGSTSYQIALREGAIRVEKRWLGEGITAYGVDGFPADCVIIALTGIMKDNPPDLVVSGINGGPNLGIDWFFSGTIGAARMASFVGIPAIAVSGLNDKISGAVEASTKWVVRFAQSPVVRDLKPPQYLTISIPRIPPSQIKGIRVAKRAGLSQVPLFEKAVKKMKEKQYEVWEYKETRTEYIERSVESDIVLCKNGYIAVVPMQADEHDYELFSHLKKNSKRFPRWF